MRFEPEISDPANAGLGIVRDMLHEVQKKHPEISEADLWTAAGCYATEFMGGPVVPHRFGRKDAADGSACPPNGRIPDASQGADHVREMFTRMGFNDQETVALIGAHTVGRCHIVRSGYDGPWTHNPLTFDNGYFVNLITKQWRPKDWTGPLQYEDVETGTLMMLPTDMALKEDPHYRVWAELYARDEAAFFRDFAAAYAKLMALGCPAECDPFAANPQATDERAKASAQFRELAMHGSLGPMKQVAPRADVHAIEATSGRTALHKAAFWGHIDAVKYLVNELHLDSNAQDADGDSPLHDAARFGHASVVQALLDGGANSALKNNAGHDSLEVAIEYGKADVVSMIRAHRAKRPVTKSKL